MSWAVGLLVHQSHGYARELGGRRVRPSGTSATSSGALTLLHLPSATSISLKHIDKPAALDPGPFVTSVRAWRAVHGGATEPGPRDYTHASGTTIPADGAMLVEEVEITLSPHQTRICADRYPSGVRPGQRAGP